MVVMHEGLVAYERVLGEAGVGRLAEVLTGQSNPGHAAVQRVLADAVLDSGLPEQDVGRQDADNPQAKVRKHVDAIANELRVPFSYLENQYPDALVQRLVLAGQGASIQGLEKHLALHLDMEVQVVSPAKMAECPPGLVAECGPASIAAMGLAKHKEG